MNLDEADQEFKFDSDAMIPIICALIPKNEDNDEDLVERARQIYDAYIDNFINK